MFKKAILVTDLSESLNTVIEHLKGLKSYGIEEILLLRALSFRQSSSIGLAYDYDRMETTLQSEKKLLEGQGFKVKAKTIFGNPEDEISKLAKEYDYSLTVVGAKEETLFRQLFSKEIAYDIVHKIERPVMLIRLGEAPIAPPSENKHILFATDFSENSEIAFETVKDLVRNGAKKVSIAHIQDKRIVGPSAGEHTKDFNELDLEHLKIMEKVLKKVNSEVVVDTVLRSGSPSVEILSLIDSLDIELTVMGTHGRGFVREIFMGSVSNHIARHSKSPVLLIPVKRTRDYE